MSLVRLVASGDLHTSMFLIEMFSALQFLYPRDVFLQDTVPEVEPISKERKEMLIKGAGKPPPLAYLCLLLLFFLLLWRERREEFKNKYQMILWGTVNTVWSVCDVLNGPVLTKLLLNKEKAASIKTSMDSDLFFSLFRFISRVTMQCLFTPTLISRSESCEYHLVASHFKLLGVSVSTEKHRGNVIMSRTNTHTILSTTPLWHQTISNSNSGAVCFFSWILRGSQILFPRWSFHSTLVCEEFNAHLVIYDLLTSIRKGGNAALTVFCHSLPWPLIDINNKFTFLQRQKLAN